MNPTLKDVAKIDSEISDIYELIVTMEESNDDE